MLIITPNYRDGVKYTARDISEVRPEHVEIAKTAISIGSSINQGATFVENNESFFFHGKDEKYFLDVKGRDYTFGAFQRKGNEWIAESWYFKPGHGTTDDSTRRKMNFDNESEARSFLISQYKKNAWGI